eukprot:TRINITY_DN56767_c0_g1_i1.p1 TRINITY_DN56767_c0_g1~~TRINITY_DN56767_c0_g1_i1.p1  ORF type:complete len:232 (-),score=28.87 TRINITY_DN56767_c0_g1_i1:92-787(-)
MGRKKAGPADPQAPPPPPPPQDVAAQQALAAERERKRREREAADAELARINQLTLAQLDGPKRPAAPALVAQQPQRPVDETAAADDSLMLLERLNTKQRSPSPKPPPPPSAIVPAGFDGAASSHRERMEARRAARPRSASRSPSFRPKRTSRPVGDVPRMPKHKMYGSENTGVWHRSRSRSERRKKSRSKSRRRRRDSRGRSSSRSNSREKKEALRKRMQKWDRNTAGHLW